MGKHRAPRKLMGAPKPYYLVRLEAHCRNKKIIQNVALNSFHSPFGFTFANGEHEIQAHINAYTNPNQVYALIYDEVRKPFAWCKNAANCKECQSVHPKTPTTETLL